MTKGKFAEGGAQNQRAKSKYIGGFAKTEKQNKYKWYNLLRVLQIVQCSTAGIPAPSEWQHPPWPPPASPLPPTPPRFIFSKKPHEHERTHASRDIKHLWRGEIATPDSQILLRIVTKTNQPWEDGICLFSYRCSSHPHQHFIDVPESHWEKKNNSEGKKIPPQKKSNRGIMGQHLPCASNWNVSTEILSGSIPTRWVCAPSRTWQIRCCIRGERSSSIPPERARLWRSFVHQHLRVSHQPSGCVLCVWWWRSDAFIRFTIKQSNCDQNWSHWKSTNFNSNNLTVSVNWSWKENMEPELLVWQGQEKNNNKLPLRFID